MQNILQRSKHIIVEVASKGLQNQLCCKMPQNSLSSLVCVMHVCVRSFGLEMLHHNSPIHRIQGAIEYGSTNIECT